MGSTAFVVLFALISAAIYLSYAAFAGSRSPLLLVVAIAFSTLASGLAWYSWAESQSVPWTIGYLSVAVVSLIAAAAGWVRGGRSLKHPESIQ